MKKMLHVRAAHVIIAIAAIFIISVLVFRAPESPQISDLLCQRQQNPSSIMDTTPEFSWRFRGAGADDIQSGYQILVSSIQSGLDDNYGDMWDSGKVYSKDSEVAYAGKALSRNKEYFWKVRVWNSKGDAGVYSETQRFRMGNHLLDVFPSDDVRSMSWNTITLTFFIGDGGIPDGGGFAILSPCDGDTWHYQFATSLWTRWQTSEPEKAGYTTASTSRSDTRISLSVAGPRHTLRVAVHGAGLQPGDTITIVYGDTSGGSPGVQAPVLARRYFFPVGNIKDTGQYDGMSGWLKYKDSPSLRVVGSNATKLHAVSHPYAKIDEKISLKVSAVDENGNLDTGYAGKVSFTSTDKEAVLPEDYTFTSFDRGTHCFEGIALKTEGLQTISVISENASGTSNVLRVTKEEPEENLFFGDVHGHSMFSDGMIWIDDHYKYMRDVSFLDFGAVTDHGESSYGFTRDMVTPYADKFYDPGSFVTFYASEWTRGMGYGHMNNYFLSGFDVYASDQYKKPEDLWRVLYGKEVITPSHHPASQLDDGPAGYSGIDHNEDFQPCVEIYSMHGSSECMDKNPLPMAQGADAERTVQYLIGERGYKMGIYASSDAHVYLMGSLMPDPPTYQPGFNHRYGTALIAAYAPELTRESLFDSIKNRHTYGTTGERILLEFSIDGNVMGSEYRESDLPEISVTVGGTDILNRIEVIKYSKTSGWESIHTERPSKQTCEFTCVDTEFADDSIYYIRAIQVDGEMAWSSPIWVYS